MEKSNIKELNDLKESSSYKRLTKKIEGIEASLTPKKFYRAEIYEALTCPILDSVIFSPFKLPNVNRRLASFIASQKCITLISYHDNTFSINFAGRH